MKGAKACMMMKTSFVLLIEGSALYHPKERLIQYGFILLGFWDWVFLTALQVGDKQQQSKYRSSDNAL